MALSWKEGGVPQFRPPPRLPGAPIPPIPNPMAKLQQLLLKLNIKKQEILAGIEAKKQELIAKAKEEVQNATRAALGIIKSPAEDLIKKKKEDIRKIKKKYDDVMEKKRQIEEKIAKLKALYEKYKNLDEVLYAEAMRLIQKQIDALTRKLTEKIEDIKADAKEKIKHKVDSFRGKLGIEKKKEWIADQKAKLDKLKLEYDKLMALIDEVQEIREKIEYIINHPEELAMQVLKPILEKKMAKIEAKIEPKRKEIEEKTKKIKEKIASLMGIIPNVPGAIAYQAFSAGVTIYWTGAMINPAPGAPNGIIVLYPGTPIAAFKPAFDFPPEGDDPAETIRQLVPMLKLHLASISGVYLLPTGTPPFTPLPWVGYGSTIEWESMFVQPVALGLKNAQDSLGNLLADTYDRAIKTGFPNAPSIPIPYTAGVSQKIKSLTMIADLKGMVDVLKALVYQIPILPIERATKRIAKLQKEVQEKYIEPIEEEKRKIEKFKEKILEYKRKIEEYAKLVQEYKDWADEQQAAVAYWSDPANAASAVINTATSGAGSGGGSS